MIPFHLCVPLLYEVSSRMNIRTITDKFPHKVNICFVHLMHKELSQKHRKCVSGPLGLASSFCVFKCYAQLMLPPEPPAAEGNRQEGREEENVS